MADISKQMDHSLENALLRQRLEQLAVDMSKKYGLTHTWEGDVCRLAGGALKDGVVKMTEKDVSIELTLGFMAKMFKAQIEQEVIKWMTRVVEPA